MMIKDIKISDIEIRENRFRPINKDFVISLAENIEENGLFNPILVTIDNVLVAGNHRLEAYKINKETFIPSNVIQFEVDENDQIIMEMSENVIRNDLKNSDKLRLFKELRILRDLRKKNGVNQYRKVDSGSFEPESTKNKKQKVIGFEKRRSDDAKEVGFSSSSEQKRVSTTVSRGIDEVVEAMDNGIITPAISSKISMMHKDEQKKALDNKISGVKIKPTIGSHEEKMLVMKKQDKFGAYVEIKCYTGDPKQTAKKIASQYSISHKSALRALIVELSKRLTNLGNKKALTLTSDLYKTYSYGIKNVSDGDIIEIKNLIKEGAITNVAISEEYSLGIQTIKKIKTLELGIF